MLDFFSKFYNITGYMTQEFDRQPQPRATVLNDLRALGISESVLSDVDGLAQLRAARQTIEQGVSLGEVVEDRETGRLLNVVGRTDDHITLSDGEDTFSQELRSVFSPLAYATSIEDLASEVVRVNRLAEKAAKDILNNPGKALE